MKRSKKYKAVLPKVTANKLYSVADAIKLASDLSYTKFVGSLEIVINLNVPTKKQNEVVRGSVVFPNQFGKAKKVVVVCDGADQKTAQAAGADEVGADELIKKIEEGYTDFDVLISTPSMMIKLAKLGKVLGPKGLMPNPRNETVTTKIEEVVKSYKSGKLDFKMNEQFAIKSIIGKFDKTTEQLIENFNTFIEAVKNETRKLGPGRFKSMYLVPTMGPAVKVDISEITKSL